MKIGLIGCGKQAPKHISGLNQFSDVEIVLADINPGLAKSLAEDKGVGWVENADDLFNDPDVRAIDISTPTPSHAPLIRQAIAADKDFFCEKPLCETAKEARELGELARTSGRIGMIGYIYRFAPVFETARSICQGMAESGASEAMGRLATALFRIGGRGSHQVWKHRLDTGGGAINEMLAHMLDLAVWFFGPAVEAEMMKKNLLRPERKIQGRRESVDAEDFVMARFGMANGRDIYIQADLLTPAFNQYVEISGENASFFGSIQADKPASLFCIDAAGGYEQGLTNFEAKPANLFERQMGEFVAALKENRQPDRCTIDDSVMVLEGLDMLRRSAG